MADEEEIVEEEVVEEEVEEEVVEEEAAAEEEVVEEDVEAAEEDVTEEQVDADEEVAEEEVAAADDTVEESDSEEVVEDDGGDDGGSVVSEEIVEEEEIIDEDKPFSIVDAIKTTIVLFIVGCLSFPVAVYLLWVGENVVEYSEMVKKAAVHDTAAAPSDGSVVKFTGPPTGASLTTPKFKFNTLYYRHTVEKEMQVKKTESKTVKKGKKKVRQKIVKYVKEWQVQKDESESKNVSEFAVGATKVKIGDKSPSWYADQLEQKIYKYKNVTPPGAKEEGWTGRKRVGEFGVRSDKDVFVCGYVAGGAITYKEGSPFVVSNKSEQAVIDAMALGEAAARWGSRIFALILLYLGFYGLFNPFIRASEFAGEYLGVLGLVAQFFYFVAAGLALFVWVVGIIAVKLLWLIAILCLVGLGVAGFKIIEAVQKARAAKGGATPPPVPA